MKIEFAYKENAVVECRALLSVPNHICELGEDAMIAWAYEHLDEAKFTTRGRPICSSLPYAMEVVDGD